MIREFLFFVVKKWNVDIVKSVIFQDFINFVLPIFILMLSVVSYQGISVNKSNKPICMTCQIRIYLWNDNYFNFKKFFDFRNKFRFARILWVFVKNSVGNYCPIRPIYNIATIKIDFGKFRFKIVGFTNFLWVRLKFQLVF